MILSSPSIQNVLISVFDKSKILDLSQSLTKQGIRLISTEGTAKMLSTAGIPVYKISDYTKFPEIMNKRLKTLHHKIYAGILSRKNIDDIIINQYNIQKIDMIIVNFYPFNSIINNKNFSHEKILEYIDIGGPNMVRAAIKNYQNVVTVVDNNDYDNILHEIKTNKGIISLKTRLFLATKALQYLSNYDTAIYSYFYDQFKKDSNKFITNISNDKSNCYFPETINCMNINFIKQQNMRYGENPHQKAALYIENTNIQYKNGSVVAATQLQGKPLSYNNIIDMDSALECVKMFTQPTCVIVKHTNPCGVSTSNTISDAYCKAYQADPISAFGGIIAINKTLDKKTAQAIITNKHFIEAIIAPNIHQECLEILSNKKNIRILICGNWITPNNIPNIEFKRISGGLLIQTYNLNIKSKNFEIVTINKPTPQEMKDALFCWKIVKFVKSNAIVCGKNYQTTGIGIGQTNRVNAVKIATSFNNLPTLPLNIHGSAMASDAFFTFTDGINIAAKMGIRCIIQPGGSIQDTTIINAANHHGISMIFTHTRQFRH